jgi:hypothetical protein
MYLYYGTSYGSLRRSNSPWYSGLSITGGNVATNRYFVSYSPPPSTNIIGVGDKLYSGNSLIGQNVSEVLTVSPFTVTPIGPQYLDVTLFQTNRGSIVMYPQGWRWVSGDIYVQEFRDTPPDWWEATI